MNALTQERVEERVEDRPVRRHPKDGQGRKDIKSFSLEELRQEFKSLGLPAFRALQVYKWLWQRGAAGFDEMTDVSRQSRVELAERYYVPFLRLHAMYASVDGTRKFIWECDDGSHIESVLIPEERRLTLCMSTQVGCAMACSFCLTGDMGLKRHLVASEIANQPLQVQRAMDDLAAEGGLDDDPYSPGESRRISNLVLMGMGEPLHNLGNLVPALTNALEEHGLNFSHRKITVSTVGLVPRMAELAAALPVNLAVSLNSTTEEQRLQVMPVTRRWSLEELLQACREFPLPTGKRITFEYVMMGGFNDTLDDAARLHHLLRGIRAKVNLIPYNENPRRQIRRPSDAAVHAFQHYLVSRGMSCSIRSTRGIDISAACGQLGKA